MIDLDELQRLSDAATPGEWGTYQSLNGTHYTVPPDDRFIANKANAALVAAARNALPELIAMGRENARLRELLKEFEWSCDVRVGDDVYPACHICYGVCPEAWRKHIGGIHRGHRADCRFNAALDPASTK